MVVNREHPTMSATYLPQKTKYRITLDLEVMEDFNPHNIDWEKVLDVQGGEHVEAYVEDLSVPDYYFS
jgi:hypothetical protein|tara:strand:+ start:1024 stop:1227 length:204 start_codon:yes stop_codon:yes gene_type:complete